jgi:hypothetical protein
MAAEVITNISKNDSKPSGSFILTVKQDSRRFLQFTIVSYVAVVATALGAALFTVLYARIVGGDALSILGFQLLFIGLSLLVVSIGHLVRNRLRGILQIVAIISMLAMSALVFWVGVFIVRIFGY